jgi:putative chitinase
MAKDAIAEIEAFEYGKPGVTVLHRGSSGDAVEDLQRKLQQVELYHGTIDGEYGPATEQAVRLLQGTLHLTVDGIFGPATSAAFAKFSQEAR